MRHHNILWFSLASALIALVLATGWWGCREADEDAQDEGIPAAAEQAARALLRFVNVGDSAEVFFVGPVAGGTILREKHPDTTIAPLVLTVPDSISGAYVFFLDDRPWMMYAHSVRYAWVQPFLNRFRIIEAKWEPLLIEPGVTPAPFSELAHETFDGTMFRYGTGGGVWQDEGDSVKAEADTLSPFATPAIPSAPCMKRALVLDAGVDANGWKRNGSASLLANNANLAQTFLEDNGFTVQRISQDPANSLPGLKPDATRTLANKLRDIIRSYAALMQCPCEGDPGCHEFFLYVCAHGYRGLFELNRYDATGGSTVDYSQLNNWLSSFLPCVKVIVFLDVCYSGSAETDLDDQCSRRADCGFTLICTCGEDDETPAGTWLIDSGTKDWSQGTTDLDGDGKSGDLGDRWLNLEDENSGNNPVRYMCSGQTRMCSTD